MRLRISALAAALICCISCIDTNNRLGGTLIPLDQSYQIFLEDSLFLKDIKISWADSLSGYSQDRIVVGAIRDEAYGLTTRDCSLTLVPIVQGEDTLLFGESPIFKNFHFCAAADSGSVAAYDQASILQNIYVYEMKEPLKQDKSYSCNTVIEHKDKIISQGIPVFGASDSLSFNFSKEFGEKFFSMTKEDLRSLTAYTKKFPGIYIKSEKPVGLGGRINIFDLQLDYDSDYGSLDGSFAKLNFSGIYDGERKDSTMYFYFSPSKIFDIDSLLTNGTVGSYPQYCLNLTGHETKDRTGAAKEKISIEGGGGLKPIISALELKHLAEDVISSYGGVPSEVVLNKASLIFPFDFPEDYNEVDDFWPDYLSPTCRIKSGDITTFMGLSDSSSSSENQGDINRSKDCYAPDITYHLQEILKIDESDTSNSKTKKLLEGEYDIWLLIMANEVVTTTTSGNSDMSEYYSYLAYQSYYNSMYGGYGYGGYSDYYTNYYSYMMMAQYASSSSTSTSVSVQLDKDRYYKAEINGPEYPVKSLRPRMEIVFSIPDSIL